MQTSLIIVTDVVWIGFTYRVLMHQFLKWEDSLRSHRFYLTALIGSVQTYMSLVHDPSPRQAILDKRM